MIKNRVTGYIIPMDNNDKIRDRIRRLAAYKNMSITALCEGAGIWPSTINKFLKNKSWHTPTTKTLNKLAVYCGFPSWAEIPNNFASGLRLEPMPDGPHDIIRKIFPEYMLKHHPDISLREAAALCEAFIELADRWRVEAPDYDWLAANYSLAARTSKVPSSTSS